ncbi:MAG: ion transporter [Candidatus Binatia bacterium]
MLSPLRSAERPEARWRGVLHEIIFEAETPAGRWFDIALIWSIVASVVIVMVESVGSVRTHYGSFLYRAEWFFTSVFTIEYILRLLSVRQPWRYATSFFGIVDILAILPTYLSVILPGSQYLLTIRSLRLLRVFRVLKLSEYLSEADIIMTALRASRRKISVFLFAVMTAVIIIGSLIYVVEGEEHGFSDIPTSVYWAIVTLTTVGYGDLSPHTPLGKMLASLVMILGYGIIAVPTGIVTAELSRASRKQITTEACPDCGAEGHDADAVHCKYCGTHL